jgi:retron-type reverse transcriptase
MISNSSIDLSLSNIYKSWYKFRKSKKRTAELEKFQYHLEENLRELYFDLNNKKYKHGHYSKFVVFDNKKREISVAKIRDRVVHRLVYEYLKEIYDKSFISDVWSSRNKKGLIGAIERTQKFLRDNPNSCIWRADIEKFFDNIDQKILIEILKFKIKDEKAIWLLIEIIQSYFQNSFKGIPIGNLTSQIFANIYLNELDRFIKHGIKPLRYLRYGDDFLITGNNLEELNRKKEKIIEFIGKSLKLSINARNNIIVKAKWGLKFLGVIIYPDKRHLSKRNLKRINNRLNIKNVSSYWGLIRQHQRKKLNEFNWRVLEKLNL